MNFTSDVKREIISRGISGGAAKKAALSAFVRTSGVLGETGGRRTFYIVSETENVAEFFTSLFGDTFGEELSVARASMDRMSGRDKLVLACMSENPEKLLWELGLLKRGGGEFSSGISRRTVPDEDCAIAYIKGAFLGGGSCILPAEGGKTGYHLEFVFPEKRTAEEFRGLLAEEELISKVVERSGAAVVYIKSKETISDFLSILGRGELSEKVFRAGGTPRRGQPLQPRGKLFFGQRRQIRYGGGEAGACHSGDRAGGGPGKPGNRA